jgi:hypothetical protein
MHVMGTLREVMHTLPIETSPKSEIAIEVHNLAEARRTDEMMREGSEFPQTLIKSQAPHQEPVRP